MKNALIAGIVGLLFMAGGFYAGFQIMPRPKPVGVAAPPPTTVTPPGAAVPMPTPDAISMDTLKQTSQSMMELNLALADREKRVAEREAKLQQEEDEITAERAALEASHEKFKALFNDFQNRLELVEANQQEQLQKQAELYNAMGPDDAIGLVRTMDDATLTRLFAVMDTKPLAKIISAWKTKYPDDAPRLLRTLSNTGEVIDKSKVALDDPLDSSTTDPAAAAPATPAPAPEAAPAPDATTPAPAPTDSSTPATDANASAPSADSSTPAPATEGTTPTDTTTPSAPQPLSPPPDVPAPKAPAQMSNPTTTDDLPRALPVEADPTTPGATADAANIPVAQPSDMSVTATGLQPRRATPVNIISTTSN